MILALGDAPLRVMVDADDNSSQMLALLDARYASSRTNFCIAVQTQLFRKSYKGHILLEHNNQYSSLFAELERMGREAVIPESHKALILLLSINLHGTLKSTASALRTNGAQELAWEYVATTLLDEYNAHRLV